MIVWVQVPSPAYAEVAELADAHGSGPCGSNTVRVQVSSSARSVEVESDSDKEQIRFFASGRRGKLKNLFSFIKIEKIEKSACIVCDTML